MDVVHIEVLPSGAVVSAAARFAEALRRRFGDAVLDVRLFGSFARSEAHEESDVDVAVVLEHADLQTRREVIDLATDVGLPVDLHISPTIFDRETYQQWRRQERPLVMDIERDGVRVTSEGRREAAAEELQLADEAGAREELEAAGGFVERIRQELE